jgi:hypothetical protein
MRSEAKRKKPRPRRTVDEVNWLAVDWSKSNIQIAEKTGTISSYVSYQRRVHARSTVRKYLSKNRPDRYANVDWSKTISEIARELSISRQCVAIARNSRFGKLPLELSQKLDGRRRIANRPNPGDHQSGIGKTPHAK